ncbi:MAG: triphosphoribosyl-dephospho-CoA synthase [Fervidicoccaceae archaeon]
MKNIERKIERAIALAVMLEPTGWGVALNVSRKRDHDDKKLQDFVVFGYDLGSMIMEKLYSEDGSGKGFTEIVEEQSKMFGTNLAFGEIFLLYLNSYGALFNSSLSPDTAAEGGTSLLYTMDPENYIKAIRISSPSFIGRFSSSIIPSVLQMFEAKERRMRLVDILRLNPFDPVSFETSRGFPYTRSLSASLVKKLSCRIPSSSALDSLFSSLCCIFTDYLTYRRKGIERAEIASRDCCYSNSANESLGSISDLVALTLFYYFLKCSGG